MNINSKLLKKNIMLKNLINFVKNNFVRNTNNSINLGRWKIEKKDFLTDIKINNANEDHCGTCIYTKKTKKDLLTDINVVNNKHSYTSMGTKNSKK